VLDILFTILADEVSGMLLFSLSHSAVCCSGTLLFCLLLCLFPERSDGAGGISV